MVGGGYPIPGLDGGACPVGGVPGVPLTRSGWWGGTQGTPPPMRQSSIVNTCYAVGGVPLAFTQKDFLVF